MRADATDNGYSKPIEGIRPVVDLNTMQVIRVEEYGHWPLPPQDCNYAADRVAAADAVIDGIAINSSFAATMVVTSAGSKMVVTNNASGQIVSVDHWGATDVLALTGSDGAGSAGRKTFWAGSGWAGGSTPSVFTRWS